MPYRSTLMPPALVLRLPPIEASSRFVIQVQTVAQVSLTREVATRSFYSERDKLQTSGVSLFEMDGEDLPFVEGRSAWLSCRPGQ